MWLLRLLSDSRRSTANSGQELELTPQLLLAQKGRVLQKAEEARQAVGHKAAKGSVPPRSQQSSAPLFQQGLGSSGRLQGRSAQLLQPLAVFGLQGMSQKKPNEKTACRYNTKVQEYVALSCSDFTCRLNSEMRRCRVLTLSSNLVWMWEPTN